KNVLLFIGDGMSLPFRTAARLVSRGMQEGKYRSMLEMDDMDHYAVVTTSGMDAIATDSANSASAYATGHKSAVNAMGVYPDNTADPNDDPRVETIVELVKRTRHMAVGLVTLPRFKTPPRRRCLPTPVGGQNTWPLWISI